MSQKDNILQELNELKSNLGAIDSKKLYSVPVGYFDELASQVLNRIKAIEAATSKEELNYLSPTLNNFTRQLPFSVPQGYFEALNENLIQNVIKNNLAQTPKEELENLSPLLSSLNKEMPFAVPKGYFEGLSSPTNPNKNKQATKIFSITNRKWFRYAAAAVVIGIVTLTGFLLLGDEKEPGVKALAKLSRDIKKMDETQKDNLMDFVDAGMSGQETAQANPATNSEVKKLLQGISEEELTDFQEQTEDFQDVLMTN
ncbi:MAG: hypothetical protein IPP02_12055 [Chitinophagaceae bacterium]|jgi:hypothetical protein|nr:hypothetical protein [Chitinophagaceae bacterium]MBK8300157.1 hypothetical protein [Chitinophagaceae bacterium]MBK9464201.1 hypothetical protein [Chitinophagaceae bacterium]MBK9658677.1 hypothetical protein [Chitinophagaceae bacterium]MBK9939100.1 hypothetical protein [Chitinophagaceae bacterium]